ncbi:MAG: hypothetical protein HY543_08600 [Deltaproteobacteria bacterium]|nr:hypothetical protein [Deltaproteobacteria bacterium]
MVEKIDRPDPPPTYQVVATSPTKDNRGQSATPQQQEDEFSSPGTEMEWRKFHTRVQDRRLLRLAREEIQHAYFRHVTLKARAVILEADLILTDGRFLGGVQFLLPHLDTYLQWKGFAIGQEIPLTQMMPGPLIEASVPHERWPAAGVPEDSGPVRARPPAAGQAWWDPWDIGTGRIRPGVVGLYVAAALAVVLIVAAAL